MLPGLDMLEANAKYVAKGGKYVKQHRVAAEFLTGVGYIGSMVLSANEFGKSAAGMIDKYLVNEEKVTIALGFEIMFAVLYGWSTIMFAGMTINLPKQLRDMSWNDILKTLKKKSAPDTAKDADVKPKADADIDSGDYAYDNNGMKPDKSDTTDGADTPDTVKEPEKPSTPDYKKLTDPDTGGNNKPAGGCFTAGTLIKTKSGYKAIEEIEAGDYVYAKNPDTGEEGYKLVARTYELDVTEIVHVYIGDVCIDATPNHPLWVDGYGFIPADELRVGDVVKTASGEKKQITSVETECYDEPVTVYNFEVMDWHTYYVSELEVLVHNSNPCANAESGSSSSYPKMDLNDLPQNVQDSFSKYDKAGWKGNVSGQTPGTNAGRKWRNKKAQLPQYDADGNPITYREFDVNDYNGVQRDGERFIVGDDGSVWYSDSHYGEGISLNGIADFVRIR